MSAVACFIYYKKSYIPPIIAAPPKFRDFRYGILSKVTPPKAMTFSLMIPSSDAFCNISYVNADVYPRLEILSKIGLKNR